MRVVDSLRETESRLHSESYLENRVALLIHQWRFYILGGITLIYFTATLALANLKPIWSDEFFTLFLSRLSGPRELWAALLTGGDQHPPLFYLFEMASLRIFGEHPLALRLPSTVGYFLMMLSLYGIVARRTSTSYGMVAMLCSLASGAYAYAYEARGYGLVLGFAGLAALCWEVTADLRFRRLGLFGLAASLFVAVSCHYYAVLVVVPIAVAELARSARRRRIDLAVWVSLSVAVVPFLLYLPLLRGAASFSATFWARPDLASLDRFYKTMLAREVVSLGAAAALAIAYVVWSRHGENDNGGKRILHEGLVLAAGLACVPVLAFVLAETVTNAFTGRYAIAGALGLALLVGYGFHFVLRGSAVAAVLVMAIATAAFSASTVRLLFQMQSEHRTYVELVRWLAPYTRSSPALVIADSDLFYKLTYYGRHHDGTEFARKLIYLTDPAASVAHLGHDTVERSMLALKPWSRLNVQPYRTYLSKNQSFYALTTIDGQWNWFVSSLLSDAAQVTLLERRDELLILRVAVR